jgi:hypothetical protein
VETLPSFIKSSEALEFLRDLHNGNRKGQKNTKEWLFSECLLGVVLVDNHDANSAAAAAAVAGGVVGGGGGGGEDNDDEEEAFDTSNYYFSSACLCRALPQQEQLCSKD